MATELFLMSSPAERAEEIVRFVRSHARDADITPLAEAAAAADFARLIALTLENQVAIFKTAALDDIEGCFTLMLSLLAQVEEGARPSVVQQIAAVATSSAEPKSCVLRLRILVNLYNTVATKAQKLEVFSTLVQYASDSKHIDALAPHFASAQSWKTKWSLTNKEAGDLFLLVSSSLEKAGLHDDAQVFIIRYLATFETEPAERRKEALPAAKKAAVNFIRAPAVSQRSNLAALAVVRDMSTDPELSKLHQLVDIFSHKTLEAYLAFQASHGAYLAELGVDGAASEETMRLLTLCTLAGAADTLTYDAVAAALKVAPSDVEGWVVRSISIGLMDARMDQQTKSLSILRTVQREFSTSQWKDLQRKLQAWRENVSAMSVTLDRRG